MKLIVTICRFLVGILFIFSGLIKANDPLGFGYKLQEYFEVFHIGFLNDYAVIFAIVLCAAEIILGGFLLLGYRKQEVTKGLLALIVFFTFLTFYSAFFEVVTSCGCFGDAIPLSPWQSFIKDLVLLLFIIVIYRYQHLIDSLFTNAQVNKVLATFIVVFSIGIGIYTYNFMPFIDFLPYKVGNNIPALMVAPPGAPADVYEIIYLLKNKKTGETKKLTDKEYLKTQIWKDTNWEIVGEPESKLLSKGYDIKIKDLNITDSQGTSYNQEILENPYYNLIIVAYNLGLTNRNAIGNLNALAMNSAENFNIRTVLLTSNSASDAERFSKENNLIMEVFYADGIPLKSMVRANPGLLLLKGGVVVGKWHFNDLPDYDDLAEQYFAEN